MQTSYIHPCWSNAFTPHLCFCSQQFQISIPVRNSHVCIGHGPAASYSRFIVYNLCQGFVQLRKKFIFELLFQLWEKSSFSKDRPWRIQVGWKTNAACCSVLFLTLTNLVLRRGQVCGYVYSWTCTKQNLESINQQTVKLK